MTERNLTLPANLVERLERLAAAQGRSIDGILRDWLDATDDAPSNINWATQLADTMEHADIDWQDIPPASATEHDGYLEDRYQGWLRSQQTDDHDG